MSGSSTNHEPAAKLTSELLARKGQARPADLLDGDSLLVTAQERPPLTLIRSDEPTIKGLFDDDDALLQDEAAVGSGSLLNFSLARPGTHDLRGDEIHTLTGQAAEESWADAPGLNAADETVDVPGSCLTESAASAAEFKRAVSDTEDVASDAAAGSSISEQPVPLAAETPTEPAENYLRKFLSLAALLVVSFAAGLWIVSWANQTLPEGERQPLVEGGFGQTANTNLENASEARIDTKQQALLPAGNEPATASSAVLVNRETHEPQVAGLSQAPVAAAAPVSIPHEAVLSEGGNIKSLAAPDLEAVGREPHEAPLLDSVEDAPVMPKPNPKRARGGATQGVPAPIARAVPATRTGYVVQLLAGRDLKTVTWEKDRLLRCFPEVAGAGPLEVKRVELEGQSAFYRVRTAPYGDAAPANELCRSLKQKNQDCLVLKQ